MDELLQADYEDLFESPWIHYPKRVVSSKHTRLLQTLASRHLPCGLGGLSCRLPGLLLFPCNELSLIAENDIGIPGA